MQRIVSCFRQKIIIVTTVVFSFDMPELNIRSGANIPRPTAALFRRGFGSFNVQCYQRSYGYVRLRFVSSEDFAEIIPLLPVFRQQQNEVKIQPESFRLCLT